MSKFESVYDKLKRERDNAEQQRKRRSQKGHRYTYPYQKPAPKKAKSVLFDENFTREDFKKLTEDWKKKNLE
ncbi:hypothetical protein [Candidatus Lokiarchaeum ossiferum]|uniref:hypothetical protein n=1 Tax=Candidatus Lokiarchaeum ossiferum TaxID=2951803 RepID=UPI00352C1231